MAYRRLGFASPPPAYNKPEVWLNLMTLEHIRLFSLYHQAAQWMTGFYLYPSVLMLVHRENILLLITSIPCVFYSAYGRTLLAVQGCQV